MTSVFTFSFILLIGLDNRKRNTLKEKLNLCFFVFGLGEGNNLPKETPDCFS